MGSREQNFYNDALTRQGFGDDVRAVQELWLTGRVRPPPGSRPSSGGPTNLLGTPAMVADRLRLYRDAGVGTLQAKLGGDHATRLDTLAQLLELVRQVSFARAVEGDVREVVHEHVVHLDLEFEVEAVGRGAEVRVLVVVEDADLGPAVPRRLPVSWVRR